MSCTAACFAKVDEGTTITSHAMPGEIVFYFGSDESLVLVFDQPSLRQFLEVAPAALRQARDREQASMAVRGTV
ncbi:MAG TPA: hypothetical protein VG317_20075 [Pseudonocardiaceae bacterium]|nr:hypothetical protein [Pseudonocardiaceae bacterium]